MMQHGIVLLMMGPLLPEMMSSFRIDEGMAGLLLSMGSLGFMAGPVIAGILIDRRGVRTAFLVGTLLEVAFLVVFGLSNVFWLAMIANFLTRFGASFIETGANVLPTLIKSKKSAHSIMNFVHLFFSVGAFIGPILIGIYLSSTAAWRPVLFFVIGPTAVLLAWVARSRLPGPSSISPRPQSGSAWEHIRRALRSRVTLFGSLSLLFYVGAEIGVSAWIVLYLQRVLGVSTFASSAGLSILWIFIMIGRYVNSVLGNKYSAVRLVTVSGIIGAISGIALINTSNLTIVFILLGITGLSLSGVFPNVMAEINRRDPAKIGTVTAVMTIGAAAGAAIFQWLMGITADAFGLRVAFYIPAFLQLLEVGAFAYAVYGRRRKGACL
jgi:fucose permease